MDKPRDSAEELQSFLCISTDRLGFYVLDLLEQLAHKNSSVGTKTATGPLNGRGISYTLITDRVTEIAPKHQKCTKGSNKSGCSECFDLGFMLYVMIFKGGIKGN